MHGVPKEVYTSKITERTKNCKTLSKQVVVLSVSQTDVLKQEGCKTFDNVVAGMLPNVYYSIHKESE